ncbi:MAG: ATP-binding cassette domain-containing protein [Bdellovibrionales bacterium]|nr:ATP-binding cassette domain-containing protein [Bdellovibrionales bacterium]
MIICNNLKKQFGPQVLFEKVTFQLGKGDKVGLVGRNGSGKSTLFKIILNLERSDEGEIVIPNNYKIGQLNQHIAFTKETLLSEVTHHMREDQSFEGEKILFGLGFSREDLEKDPKVFSGGFQIRIELAKALLRNPDMLLLDEPTNYLDITSLRWLRSYLKTFNGELVLITHDRRFMDSIVTHTMGIHRKKLKKVKGKTSDYYHVIAEEEENYTKTMLNQEKKRKEIEKFVERFKSKASKARQAQSKVKVLKKMEELKPLEKIRDLSFHFNYKHCPGKELLKISNYKFGYQPDNLIIDGVSVTVGGKDRIAIIGPNGKGKSTLLNLMAAHLTPEVGERKEHPSLQIGYFGQTHKLDLDLERSVFEEIQNQNADLNRTDVMAIAGAMMFSGDLADKKIKVLSGGEKNRVLLGKAIARPANILFLDEPTHHLDLESVTSLQEAIEAFEGAVVIVTHDEELIKTLATKLIVFQKNKIEYFDGTYEEFLEKIGWEEEEVTEDPRKLTKMNKKLLQKERHRIQEARKKECGLINSDISDLESKIVTLEDYQKVLENDLILASQSGDGQKVGECSKTLSEVEGKIEQLFEELDSLSQKLQERESFYENEIKDLEC